MTDIRLSEHFMLSEFTRSSTAERLGICNELDPFYPTHKDIIANLRNLCEQVLEPLRAYVRQPIIISSGYRSPALNQALRGAPRSQHLTGEAADIRLPTYNCRGADGQSFTNLEQLNKRFLWLMNNTDFDQLIKETTNRQIYWIHVSCKSDRSRNRHQVIHFLLK